MWHIVDGEIALTIAGEEQVLDGGLRRGGPAGDPAFGPTA